MINLFDKITFDIFQIIKPIVYIAIGVIVYEILKNVIKNSGSKTETVLKIQQSQRIKTVKMLIINIIKYVIVIVILLATLANFGINITSLVAGLGITTAIIGLAFQDLAKDLIAGFSIITEAQYDVGDTIEVDGFMGEVVFLGLKTTRIRNYKGATKIIANHNMDKIINYSLNNSLAVVDVAVGYEHSPEEVEKVLNKLSNTLEGKIENTIGKIQIWGINELEDSGVVYRVVLETDAMQQFVVERKLRREIKNALDKENIKIPFPQVEVHNGK